MANRVLILGDLHAPWVDKAAISRIISDVKSLPKNMKPTHIIQMGDAYDLFSLSRFPRSHDIIKPEEEILEGRMCLEEIWRILHKVCPKAKKIQLLGNHDIRWRLRLEGALPELLNIVNLDHLWQFDHVTTVKEVNVPYMIDEIGYVHGYLSGIGPKHATKFKMDIWRGHDHKQWIVHNGIHFEASCGLIGQVTSKVFNYAKPRWDGWSVGYGWQDELGPRNVRIG